LYVLFDNFDYFLSRK